MKLFQIAIILFSIGCSKRPNPNTTQIYKTWNDSSMTYLKKQIVDAKDEMQKKLLSNEMISLSMPRPLDKKNARLSMVKEFDYLLSDKKTPFYVIEYGLKGERNVHVNLLIVREDEKLKGYVYRIHPDFQMVKSGFLNIGQSYLDKLFMPYPFPNDSNSVNNLTCCFTKFSTNNLSVKYFPSFSMKISDGLYKLFFEFVWK